MSDSAPLPSSPDTSEEGKKKAGRLLIGVGLLAWGIAGLLVIAAVVLKLVDLM